MGRFKFLYIFKKETNTFQVISLHKTIRIHAVQLCTSVCVLTAVYMCVHVCARIPLERVATSAIRANPSRKVLNEMMVSLQYFCETSRWDTIDNLQQYNDYTYRTSASYYFEISNVFKAAGMYKHNDQLTPAASGSVVLVVQNPPKQENCSVRQS